MDREGQIFSHFDSLKQALSHDWFLDYIFASAKLAGNEISPAIRPHALVYMLADVLWTHNMRHLDKEVKRISCHNRNPQSDTDRKLHTLREDIEYLKSSVQQTHRHAPATLQDYFLNASDWPGRPDTTPLDYLSQLAEDATALQTFLTDSLNLLLASLALEGNERANILTVLAAVYVPLSFVASIFGMNLKELNGSDQPLWVCLEVLGVVLIVTAAVIMGYVKRAWICRTLRWVLLGAR